MASSELRGVGKKGGESEEDTHTYTHIFNIIYNIKSKKKKKSYHRTAAIASDADVSSPLKL